jgi:hypothetical protein
MKIQLLFDGGAVTDYLNLVKTFLDNNPNEVITFLFTNPEGLSVSDIWKPAFDSAGMSSPSDRGARTCSEYSKALPLWPTFLRTFR